MFIDTHCHLELDDPNLNEVITEMKDNIIIVSGYDIKSNREVLELIKYDNIYGTIGYHPSEINNYDLELIEQNINNPKIVGIGEIGLDYHYDYDKKLEKELFIKQLDLARKYNKTVVIHSRDAAQDTLEILKNYYDLKIVMHCFSYSLEIAKELIKHNVKLGIGGVLTFKNSIKLKEIVKEISIDNFLLETDSPYLTPEPFRGKKNKPSNSYIVAKKIAEIKNIDEKQVCDITTKNAMNQFDLKL